MKNKFQNNNIKRDLEKKVYILIKKSLKNKKRLRQLDIRRKRGELMKEILISIALGISIPAIILMFPNIPKNLLPIIKNIAKRFKTNRKNLIKSIQALKKQNLIKMGYKDGRDIIQITEKGKTKLLSYSLDLIEFPKKIKWDGYWRVIIFDIPNKLNLARVLLVKTLKNLGCYQLQRSVYVYPFDIKDELDFISALFNVYEYIIYIKAEKIEGEEVIYKHFKASNIL